jgi:hypothetical protein
MGTKDVLIEIDLVKRKGGHELSLKDAQLDILPDSVGQLTTLETLDVSNNRLAALPDSLGQLVNLKGFNVSHNQLAVLPDSLGQLANLQGLGASNNQLTALPHSLGQLTNLEFLLLDDNCLTTLPDGFGQLVNLERLHLNNNKLAILSENFGLLVKLGSVILSHNQLTTLPNSLGQLASLQGLNLSHNQLTTLPNSLGQLDNLKWLDVSDNPLIALPVMHVAYLNISDCQELTFLPEGMVIRERLDLANTALTGLPTSLQDIPLFWNGVQIDKRIAFHPETLTAEEALQESNVQVRRIMLERMGYRKFLAQAQADLIHEDMDNGRKRQLLYVPMDNDEPLVCLSASDPATERQYIIRVPPTTITCHQAVTWIGDFDHPNEYRPIDIQT